MKTVEDLQAAGYEIMVKEKKVICRWVRDDPPDPRRLAPLVNELRSRKDVAIEYLQSMPGNCESCPAAVHWDGYDRWGLQMGRYCFYSAYFEGKATRPVRADKIRGDCPKTMVRR